MLPPTIYRALDFLLENHFTHRIESLNAYLMCEHFGCQHPMQLLICDHCKQVIELSDPLIDDTFSQQAQKSGFQITNKILEAHGICQDCANNQQLKQHTYALNSDKNIKSTNHREH